MSKEITKEQAAELIIQVQALQYGIDQIAKFALELTNSALSMNIHTEDLIKTFKAFLDPTPKEPVTSSQPIVAGPPEELPSSKEVEPLPEKLEIQSIIWEEAKGAKGIYEKAVFYSGAEVSGAQTLSNSHFELVERELGEKRTKFLDDGMFYWLFENERAIGRKSCKRGRRKY